MNKVIMMGRLTRDPDVRYSQGAESMAISKFSIAVDRGINKKNDGPDADFFNCTAFGKKGEFVEKYLKQGMKILLTGRIQNNNYTNKNGEKVYSAEIIAEDIEFAESKKKDENDPGRAPEADADGFVPIPDDVANSLPFK